MSNKFLDLIKSSEAKWVDFRFTDTKGKEQHVSYPADSMDDDNFEEGKMENWYDRMIVSVALFVNPKYQAFLFFFGDAAFGSVVREERVIWPCSPRWVFLLISRFIM